MEGATGTNDHETGNTTSTYQETSISLTTTTKVNDHRTGISSKTTVEKYETGVTSTTKLNDYGTSVTTTINDYGTSAFSDTTGNAHVTSALPTGAVKEHGAITSKGKKLVTDVTSHGLPNITIHSSASESSGDINNTVVLKTTVAPALSATENVCNSSTSVAIVTSVSVVVVLVVLLTSVVCFFRLRHKWRAKVQLERKKTDIWSMATFNNTIINENFTDYQLAPPTNDMRKSSGFSENSIQFYDPFSGSAPHSQYSFDSNIIQSKGPPGIQVDDSTLRRNTFSAPSGLSTSMKALAERNSSGSNDKSHFAPRDRSSTFTVGKRHKTDRHVLLSHEELLETTAPEHIGALYTSPTHSYYVTEL